MMAVVNPNPTRVDPALRVNFMCGHAAGDGGYVMTVPRACMRCDGALADARRLRDDARAERARDALDAVRDEIAGVNAPPILVRHALRSMGYSLEVEGGQATITHELSSGDPFKAHLVIPVGVLFALVDTLKMEPRR
jgi:hypothetical protein